jgi:HEAT repeat protein
VRSELRERAIGQLLESSRSADPSIRANAAEAAQQAPARLDAIVASALKDENIGVRSVAAAIVGKAKLGTLSPSVRPLIHDPSPFVRASAIFGLRATGDDVDPSPLSTFLLNDPSPRVRSHAAYLLGEQGDRSALPMLRAAAKRTMPRASEAEVRLMQLQLAEAMVKLGDEAQIQSIRAALYPSRPEELEATALAVQILGQLKDRGSIDQLIFLSGKTDETGKPMPAEVRLGIAIALAQMGNRRGNFIAQEFWKNENPVVRAQAAAAFGATAQSDGLAFLDELLDDPSEQVRTAAAAAILRCVGVR